MDDYEKSKQNTGRYTKLKRLLKMVYGYDEFKPKQYEIINRVINGEDICAILPTGYGKSLTFQVPAIYLDKPAIVITPLISLMNDQRIILDKLGLTSCCYNSTVDNKTELRKEIIRGDYQFIYITPESMVSQKDFLLVLKDTQGISLVAIDEAHCISSYGFDFRPEYRKLKVIKKIFPDVPVLAVTATATKKVEKDICAVLKLDAKPIKTSFNRPNLYIEVRKKHLSKDCTNPIAKDIIPILNEHKNKPVIIYCLTIKETLKIADVLNNHKYAAGIYHGKMSKEDKQDTHNKFINGEINCVVATIAFGMGINKSDVRAVIHYGCPKNLEGYYQEIGRAGRDGKLSYCYALYNMRDFTLNESLIRASSDEENIQTQINLLKQMKRFIMTDECRRKILLDYFDEDTDNLVCNFCDNCCGKKQIEKTVPQTKQDVQYEAKMFIDLIESIQFPPYGAKMYINILRGSKERTITPKLAKNKFYGKGAHKSVVWWKELCDNLIRLQYIRQDYVKGKFMILVLKVTKKGVLWSSMAGLEELGGESLEPISMTADA